MSALASDLFATTGTSGVASRVVPRVAAQAGDAAMTAALPPSAAPPLQDGLGAVLRHPGIWRRSAPVVNARAMASGWRDLDAVLPGGGWPVGALTEVLVEADGLGELGLLMPALAALTRQRRRVVFVAPPYLPYAPALAGQGLDLAQVTQIDCDSAGSANTDEAWSAEQCLRSGACGAVLLWARSPDYTQLRRWQLAAESGGALGFLFRPAAAMTHASPAALRLRVRGDGDASSVEILKCRGGFDHRDNARFRWRA
jgi:hypothetical protein